MPHCLLKIFYAELFANFANVESATHLLHRFIRDEYCLTHKWFIDFNKMFNKFVHCVTGKCYKKTISADVLSLLPLVCESKITVITITLET